MDQIIARATRTIRNRIEWNSRFRSNAVYSKMLDDSETIDHMTATYNSLNRLLELEPNDSNWTQLFCRRLGRFMDNNLLFTKNVCIELYDDISYILKESSVRHDKRSWMCFLARMEFEAKLEQRELQARHSAETVKELDKLYLKHGNLLTAYIQKCITLHSKVYVRELIENMDRLLCRTCDQEETLFTPQSREHLHTELKCIKINFDCSGKLLKTLLFPSSIADQLNNKASYSYRNFLPSVNQLQCEKFAEVQNIESALSSRRWFIILGDPGSAKTTLLRWITCVFAEAALHRKERVLWKGLDLGPTRIPILIQISEFAKWLTEHPMSPLIDYIGEHTWARELYIGEEGAKVLKELVVNDHVLILLDGLDEILEIRRREEIVDIVRKFIDDYVRAPNFISAFDDAPFNTNVSLEMQSPKKFGGNQVIVTSRIVGYYLYPLNGPFIEHFLLLSMNKEESSQFITEWIDQIEHSINGILMTEGIMWRSDFRRTLMKKQYDALNMLLRSSAPSLVSNPLILSVICMSMFNSSDELLHKCRIQVYDYAARSAVRTWERLESKISKSVLIDVLIDLAAYLHLRSPSGLIDEFDLNQFCCYILKQQSLSHDNTELREYVKELTVLLGHQLVIISERGLQVFGFSHLSFQEYFVARSLVRCPSIDEMAQRILAFTINPRFREPLLLALGWISWKHSSDDHEEFCHILVTQTGNFVYPLGALLLFDAFEDIQTLPSNSILFAALNSLLDHTFSPISIGYFGKNLSKLCQDAQMDWLQTHLTNEKRLLRFCQCILHELDRFHRNAQSAVPKLITPAIIHQLWTFRNKSASAEYIIDETLQKVMQSNISLDHIYDDKLSSPHLSLDNWKSDMHPLVSSVIIALCGGFHVIFQEAFGKLEFSPKYIHNKSSILAPINEYIANTEEHHYIKIQRLIHQYESVLRKSGSTDTSADIVDNFVALICLRGLSHLSIYEEFSTHQAFPLAIQRFKRIALYLIKLYDTFNNETSKPLIASEVETVIHVFFSESTQHNEQLIEFSLACSAALRKLETNCWQNLLNFDIYRDNDITWYLQLQPEFCERNSYKRDYDSISIIIQRLQMLRETPLFLLTFVPPPLQDLYKLLIIEPVNEIDSLPLVILLSESFLLIENIEKNHPVFFVALIILLPLFEKHKLENYALALLWENNLPFGLDDMYEEDFLQAMNNIGWSNPFSQCLLKNWELLIDQELQHIDEAEYAIYDRDLQLFVATISLARLYQARFRSRKNKATKDGVYSSLSTNESKIVYSAIEKMTDPIIQMLAWSTVLVFKKPFIFDEEQRNDLKRKTISPLKDLPEFLPLLTATLLFVRCYTVRQFHLEHFQQISHAIIKQLNSELSDQQSQEAAYIALRTLNSPVLACSLSVFEKRTMNLSHLRQMNSVIFFHYFTNTASFGLSNTSLLSSMYLAELSVDVEILKMYTNPNKRRTMPPLVELYQLSNGLLTSGDIMTLEAAIWINDNLQLANKNEITKIIEYVSTCRIVERQALPALEKWLQYCNDEDLKFFAHYGGLQLAKEGRNFPDLIEIISKLYDCDYQLVFECITRDLLELEVVDFKSSRQIFVTIIQGAYRSSMRTSASVRSQEILDLILELELQRINSTILQRTGASARSYLWIVGSCSPNVQLYLAEHLCNCVNAASKAQNSVQEDYLAIAMKWMIIGSLWNNEPEAYSPKVLQCIYTFLCDKQFPQVQRAIANGLNVLFFGCNLPKEHVFVKNDVMNYLEQVIHSYATTIYPYTDDVLASCLLAYGNGLLRLQRVEIGRIVSDKTSNLLKMLFQTSSSDLIAARAFLCNVFSQTSNATRSIIFSHINRLEIPPETSYNILLQQTLYQIIDHDLRQEVKIITEYLKTCSRKVIGKFVAELYDYLRKTDSTNYLSDVTPDYLNVAIHFIDENFDTFLHTLQESTFGEQKFKTTIYYANQRTHNVMFAALYAGFGVITVELVAMLACYKDFCGADIRARLKKIKQISDRDTVEYLFNTLETTLHLEMLTLIVQLAEADLISPLEVHQRVSSILRNISHRDDEICLTFRMQLYRGLIKLSCIEQVQLSISQTDLYAIDQTDMDSSRDYLYLDQLAPLFLRRRFFIPSVSFLMNSSTKENYSNVTSDPRISAHLSE